MSANVSLSNELSDMKVLLKRLAIQAKANSLSIQELTNKRNLIIQMRKNQSFDLDASVTKRIMIIHVPPVDVSNTDQTESCSENDCGSSEALATNFLLPDEGPSDASTSDSSRELPVIGSNNAELWVP